METRRHSTRIVKLPGLPEILRRNSTSARIIDATVKPPPPPRASERSSLFQTTAATATTTMKSNDYIRSPPPIPKATRRYVTDAIPRRKPPLPTAVEEVAPSRNSTPNIATRRCPTPQRRATSLSPAKPPAEWFIETVEQLNSNLNGIMQEIKYLHERFEAQNHHTQERIHQTQEQIETLNRSLEDYVQNKLPKATITPAQHQYIPQPTMPSVQPQSMPQPTVSATYYRSMAQPTVSSTYHNHNSYRAKVSRPPNETAFTTYGDTRRRTDSPLSARLRDIDSPDEVLADVSMASREYLYRNNILNSL